jgi:hypothetical protein
MLVLICNILLNYKLPSSALCCKGSEEQAATLLLPRNRQNQACHLIGRTMKFTVHNVEVTSTSTCMEAGDEEKRKKPLVATLSLAH